MHESVEQVVVPFLAAADAALDHGYSAVLYGSAARGDFLPGRSNINLLLVMDDASPSRLTALGTAFAAWRRATWESPLVITRAEWERASDVFPIEITDMRAGYRVLRGSDPVAGAVVEPGDLRQALERELRGKLLRLRQGYAAAAGDAQALGLLAAASAPAILVLLRSLLTLAGRPVPQTVEGVVTEAATLLDVPASALASPVAHRGERGWRCSTAEFEQYLGAVANAASYVDHFQLGDQR
jgi:predicted nucleotidyltransferase